MDDARAGAMVSPRRRREVRGSGESFPRMRRTTSNISSTSSDMLVAVAGRSQDASQQSPRTSNHFTIPVSRNLARNQQTRPFGTTVGMDGSILKVRFGSRVSKERFRVILRAKPRPVSVASKSAFSAAPGQLIRDEVEQGPNRRGTYSKEYTLQHPDIKFVHRGQGRYVPASDLSQASPATTPVPLSRPRRQVRDHTPASEAIDTDTFDRMIQSLEDHFDAFRRKNNPSAKEKWSPSFRHQYQLILNHLKKTPRQSWPEAIQGIRDIGSRNCVYEWNREMDQHFPVDPPSEAADETEGARARLSRRAKNTLPPIEGRRSQRISDIPRNPYLDSDEDDEEESTEESEDSPDPDQTYTKEYVDAHPNEKFHHTGNGWYKRGPRSNESTASSERRDSTASRPVRHSVGDITDNTTVKSEQLHLYPGLTFHHKGNGWYKVGMAPDGRRGSIVISAEGKPIKRDQLPENSAQMTKHNMLLLDENATVNRDFTLRYPHIEWIHRGQGRYKRKSAVFGNSTPVASSERHSSKAENSSSKDYAESFTSADLRRASDRRRSSKTVTDALGTELEEIVDKDYVDALPEGKSQLRGQGRYARGNKPSAPSTTMDDEPGADGLVSTSYVERHPDETFHHRGQGKWARGLPPPDASNKTAIRGPGAQVKTATPKTGEENEAGEKPPPLNALLRKDEGPMRWPHLHWIYRGGGKWCRQTKEEAQRTANPGQGTGQPKITTARARTDGPEAQLQREALAAENADGVGRVPLYLQRPAKIVRKRSAMSAANEDNGIRSKASSNCRSKAPTPRPPLLPPEADQVTEEDLPSLYKDEWSEPEEDELDEPDKIIRKTFDQIVGAEPFVKALTKHDPAVRSLDSLKLIAGNAQQALRALQDEYLQLDVVVSQQPMHGKKERRPVKGGRQTVEHDVWEDKKEAMLYDYNFDPRKIGYQDPDAQRIQRDEEGRELRRRRRNDLHATAVDYGDGEMTSRRRIKPVSRFDGVVVPPPRKRSRLAANTDDGASPTADPSPNMTPERINTPVPNASAPATVDSQTRGRKDIFPKRIRELRGESVGSTRSDNSNASSSLTKPAGIRKGRPPGSKNQHKRKDAGIKKGPRKPKVNSVEPEAGEPMDGVVPAIVENPSDDMPAAAAAAPDHPMGMGEAVTKAFSLAAARA
ncbi:Hypothetical predicted protein [Lecanosticta acicola]|uniref:Uncharacterized protein n=1 Tax=Lecanosticta acicola TaxID=111012 RepID=A0AAI8Z7A5_9PEZI|nr:Hypothetical predicted protein [Lecanosticta acicola]